MALALQPVGTALFANSPFTEGKPNGFVSFSSEIWRDTDKRPRRHAAVGVRAGHGLRALRRLRARCADVFHQARRPITSTFTANRSAIISRASSFPASAPRCRIGPTHVSTIFPEVRLKRYIEMRGSDGGPWRRLPSLPAFWVGLIYDDASLDACWEIVKDWTAGERQKLRDDVPRLGFKATIRAKGCSRSPSRRWCWRTGAGPPQEARSERSRRDRLPAAAPGDRGARHYAGGRVARKIPRAVERLGRSDLRRIRVLSRRSLSRAQREGLLRA